MTRDIRGTDPAGDSHGLRAEVDRLRREVHTLAVELDRADRRTRRREAVTARMARLELHYRSLRARVGRAIGRKPVESGQFNASFRPYDVRPQLPLEEGRRKVLHFIANFHTGGSARLIVDLIEHLGHRFDHVVIARDLPAAAAYTGLDIQQAERISIAHVTRRLRSIRPDIVHVHYVGHRDDEWALADWRWYRVIFDALRDFACPVIENVNIPVVPFFSDRVRCYVHVSDYVKHAFGHGDDHNITIHPGSDLSFFSRDQDSTFEDNAIGMIYRLDGDKVDERGIDVFLEVVSRRPGTRALIVGGGYHLDAYRSRVREAGLNDAFTFPGYVSYYDLPAWLEQMSVFVAPVHAESFGQVGPFAMGMQLPVVGYNVGALAEITGDTAVLSAAGDHARLADIVIDLLNDRDRRLRIGRANRQRAEQLFSVQSMVASYHKLYESLLREGPCTC